MREGQVSLRSRGGELRNGNPLPGAFSPACGAPFGEPVPLVKNILSPVLYLARQKIP